MDSQEILKNAPEQSCKSIAVNLSEWKCPHCYQDYNGLSIDSSIEMNVSIISCSECGLHFGDKCSEEELIKKFKKEYVMDKPMREMSLIELISSLPESHIARREYTEFLGRLSKEKNESAQAHQEIEELKRERDELAAKHEELMIASWELKEGVPDAYYKVKSCLSALGKEILAKRDLEQQAKGIEDFANRYCGECKTLEQTAVSVCASQSCEKLRTQAKELV